MHKNIYFLKYFLDDFTIFKGMLETGKFFENILPEIIYTKNIPAGEVTEMLEEKYERLFCEEGFYIFCKKKKEKDFYLISSFGGCGTTFLIDFVLKYKKVNDRDNKDGLKHARIAPDLSFVKKAVYIYGKPENVVVYHFSQRKKGLMFWPVDHCRKMGGDWANFSHIWDLEDFLKNGKDLYMFENHLDGWTNSTERDYKIMFIKYESLWDHLPELFDFLDIDKKEIGKFPARVQRKTDWRVQSENNKKMIFKIYGKFSEKVDNLPEIFVK